MIHFISPNLHNPSNDTTSGISLSLQVLSTKLANTQSKPTTPTTPKETYLQISSAHTAYYPPPTTSDHTAPTRPSTDSSHAHPRISDNRPRWIWRWPVGWRRFGRYGRHQRRGHGCRRRRICRGRRLGEVRRPGRGIRVGIDGEMREGYFEAEDFGLGEGEGLAVYFDEAFASLSDSVSIQSREGGKVVMERYLAMCDGGCC